MRIGKKPQITTPTVRSFWHILKHCTFLIDRVRPTTNFCRRKVSVFWDAIYVPEENVDVIVFLIFSVACQTNIRSTDGIFDVASVTNVAKLSG